MPKFIGELTIQIHPDEEEVEEAAAVVSKISNDIGQLLLDRGVHFHAHLEVWRVKETLAESDRNLH